MSHVESLAQALKLIGVGVRKRSGVGSTRLGGGVSLDPRGVRHGGPVAVPYVV